MRRDASRYIEHLRKLYPRGSRVKLEFMDDVQAPPIGTLGTVMGIDDLGQIIINWDNGSNLSVIIEAGDRIKKV